MAVNISKKSVLVLNANWQAINVVSIETALGDMNSRQNPKVALKIEYAKVNNEWDFSAQTEITPLNFDEWTAISPRDFDTESIRTSNLVLRVPTVIITKSFNKVPKKTFSPTLKNLFERYGGKCYWTGKDLSLKGSNIEHVISKDEWKKKGKQGSPNSWSNLAPSDPAVNSLKGNMSPEEFTAKHGYKPQYKLSEPKPVPASVLIKEMYPDWAPFLPK